MGVYASLLVLMDCYGLLCVLMGLNWSLWVHIEPHKSLCALKNQKRFHEDL